MRTRALPEGLRIAFAAAALLLAGAAAADELDAVMGALARAPHGTVSFQERQFLALLDKPVESSGVLIYQPPDHLEKRTLKPRPASLIADGDVLTVQRGRRQHVLRLSEFPQAAPFIDCIRATLAGDRARLQAHFEVQMSGTLEDWRLVLTPKASANVESQAGTPAASPPAGATAVRKIDISGTRGQLRRVEILQSDADRSELLIQPPPA
jgi:outer membrane lipoprotein-sorting protein